MLLGVLPGRAADRVGLTSLWSSKASREIFYGDKLTFVWAMKTKIKWNLVQGHGPDDVHAPPPPPLDAESRKMRQVD